MMLGIDVHSQVDGITTDAAIIIIFLIATRSINIDMLMMAAMGTVDNFVNDFHCLLL